VNGRWLRREVVAERGRWKMKFRSRVDWEIGEGGSVRGRGGGGEEVKGVWGPPAFKKEKGGGETARKDQVPEMSSSGQKKKGGKEAFLRWKKRERGSTGNSGHNGDTSEEGEGGEC